MLLDMTTCTYCRDDATTTRNAEPICSHPGCARQSDAEAAYVSMPERGSAEWGAMPVAAPSIADFY